MGSEKEKVLTGQVFAPDEDLGTSSNFDELDLSLHMPPDVKGLTMSKMLLGQLPYWGAARTINAYRKMVDAGIDAAQSQEQFLVARRNLEAETERWNNRDKYRDAAKLEAEGFLDAVKGERHKAAANLINSEMLLSSAKHKKAGMALLLEIDDNNREIARLKSKRKVEEAQQRLDETRGGKAATFRRKMQMMELVKQNFAELNEAKEIDIEKYGSEEDLPEYLQTMYAQMEADLMFALEDK